MVRAILFDMGGTLDGDGHWLDRFVALYARCGVELPREALRAAFDAAEARAAADEAIANAGIDLMVGWHVDWQLEHLAIRDEALRDRLVHGFVDPIRAASAANARVLREFAARGLLLGIVSNGCGNVEVLCRDYGFAPFLSAVVDSRRVGISKPDPRIFTHAAALIGVAAADIVFVGDSFERDIVPAHQVGMTTAWLQPDASLPVPDPSAVDIRLQRLGDLATLLPVVASN